MQMYRVRFARMLSDDVVDMGDCIVCAANNDAAIVLVAAMIGVPVSKTEFECVRIKPSLYLIGRKQVHKSLSAAAGGLIDAAQASSATFPDITENLPDEFWHDITASATIRAENENEAIVKLAKAILREMSGEKQKSSTRELDIKCDRRELHPRKPAIEQNALYTHLRFFKGGDTRT